MFWRPRARLLTGPLAFVLAGIIDLLRYATAAAWRRASPGGRKDP